MSSNNGNKYLLNDIELEMKSNHNTNSDIISLDDDIPKKEIIYENGKSEFTETEIKFIKKENNHKLLIVICLMSSIILLIYINFNQIYS